MCSTKEPKTQWIKNGFPQQEGDWLWIAHWGCGCLRDSGIAWIEDVTDHGASGYEAGKLPTVNYKTNDGRHLAIHWGSHEPFWSDGDEKTIPDVDAWLAEPLDIPRDE